MMAEYTEELFDDSRPDRPEDYPELEGYSILKSEITAAFRSMKNDKAPGNDILKDKLEACGNMELANWRK